jgi:hypothetical protein
VKVFFSLLLVVLLFGACSSEQLEPFWQGSWARTIHVPKDMSGRCFDEQLLIEGKKWRVNAILHATDVCNNPYLSLSYQGVLQEVHIKRNTDNLQMTFQVEDIELVAMADISGNSRQELAEGVIKSLSAKYVPEENKSFSQTAVFDASKQTMKAGIFEPLLLLAIPDSSSKDRKRLKIFKREQESLAGSAEQG